MAIKRFKINSKWPGVYGLNSTKKRINGRPDVCYYINFRADGRLVWEKIGWKGEGYSPEVASEIRGQRIKTARHGDVVKTQKEIRQEARQTDRTLDEIKEAYFSSARGLKIKGRNTDLNRYEKHLKSLFGNRQVSTLVELDVDRVKFAMSEHKIATISNALELLRRLINHGVKHELCLPLSFTIKLPKKNNEVVEHLTPEEGERLNQVLAEWPNQDVARMVKFAMLTGARRGEIFKLQCRDVDFHQRLIHLRDPKGGTDVSIPMSNPVADILNEQMELLSDRVPESYIYPGRGGAKRVDCSAVKRIKAAADLPSSFRIFHGLRHHFGVTLANSGKFTLDMIGDLLTHKDTAMTRRYAQFLPDTKKKAADLASEILQASTESQTATVLKINSEG